MLDVAFKKLNLELLIIINSINLGKFTQFTNKLEGGFVHVP
jgi:hypothetical protein